MSAPPPASSLLLLPEEERILKEVKRENKFCFICKERGPTYVDVDHSIFVCTFCSGVLREFAFKIKSTSQSKFTLNEVKQLRSFSNVQAAHFWLNRFTASHPKPGELEKIRSFIKATFVNNRWLEEDEQSFSSPSPPPPTSSAKVQHAPPPPPTTTSMAKPGKFTMPQIIMSKQQVPNNNNNRGREEEDEDDFGDFESATIKNGRKDDDDDEFDDFVGSSFPASVSASTNPFTLAKLNRTLPLLPGPLSGRNVFDRFT